MLITFLEDVMCLISGLIAYKLSLKLLQLHLETSSIENRKAPGIN